MQKYRIGLISKGGILLLLAISIVVSSCTGSAKIEKEGRDRTFTTGEHVIAFLKEKDLSSKFRVFGISTDGIPAPFDYITAYMTILPFDEADAIFRAQNCEANAVSASKLYPVLTDDPQVKQQLIHYSKNRKKYNRLTLTLEGEIWKEKSHIYKGKELKLRGASFDLNTCLFLTNIRGEE